VRGSIVWPTYHPNVAMWVATQTGKQMPVALMIHILLARLDRKETKEENKD